MTHVFEGEPDKRQLGDEKAPMSRFRPTYRALTDDEKALHDEIKAKAVELEALIEQVRAIRTIGPAYVPPAVGRYAALALTELEISVMWAVKALTS